MDTVGEAKLKISQANSVIKTGRGNDLLLEAAGGGENFLKLSARHQIEEFSTIHLHLNYSQESTLSQTMETFLTASAISCCILGILSIFLNIFVIVTLCNNRKKVRKNVFYMLVTHCGIVDCFRGVCVVLWCLPFIYEAESKEQLLLFLKVNQLSLMYLRSANLLTILNLLLFTVNEYVVIKHPLFYRRVSRQRIILIALVLCWLVSLTFGVSSVLARGYAKQAIFVAEKHQRTQFVNSTSAAGVSGSEKGLRMLNVSRDLDREDGQLMIVHYGLMFAIMFLCYTCLIAVAISYGTVFSAIRRYHSIDESDFFNSTRDQKAKESIGGNRGSGRRHRRHASQRRWRCHVLSRHKYILVIGSVLIVDILFLLPYSAIQIVSFLLFRNFAKPEISMQLRWIFQILIGLHAVCQPGCYFRMTEFRKFAAFCYQHQQGPAGSTAAYKTSTWMHTAGDVSTRDHGTATENQEQTTYNNEENSGLVEFEESGRPLNTKPVLKHKDSATILREKLKKERGGKRKLSFIAETDV